MPEQFTQGPSILQSDIVNNLTTDSSTKPLSAAQGKVLDGNLSQVRESTTISGSSLSDVQSGIVTLASTMSDYSVRQIKFSLSSNSGELIAATYYGKVTRHSSTIFIVEAQAVDALAENSIIGTYRNNGWTWNKLALNSNISSPTSVTLSGSSAIKTHLETVANGMAVGDTKVLRIVNSDSSFTLMGFGIPYEGFLYKQYTGTVNQITWNGYDGNGDDINFSKNGSNWYVNSLSSKITLSKVTISFETGYSIDTLSSNEVYAFNGHAFGSLRFKANSLPSGWTSALGTMTPAPKTEINVPAINSNNGTYLGILSIKSNGEITVYNSGSALTNAHVACCIAF